MEIYTVKVQEKDDLLQTYPSLQRYLTVNELETIKKFRNQNDRNVKLVSRILLKYLLAKKQGMALEEVEVYSNPYGKLFVKNSSLQFNLSHSGNMILYGFDGCALGVDIEELVPVFPETAKLFMSDAEYKYFLNQLEESLRKEFFYKVWTAKESLLKAAGTGITSQITQIHLPINSDIMEINYQNSCYFFHHGKLDADYMYSVCIRNQDINAPVFTILSLEEVLKEIINSRS